MVVYYNENKFSSNSGKHPVTIKTNANKRRIEFVGQFMFIVELFSTGLNHEAITGLK